MDKTLLDETIEVLGNVDTELSATGRASARIKRLIDALKAARAVREAVPDGKVKVTLTAAEIVDLAAFTGLEVRRPDDIEPDTEIDVYPCPPEGVRYEGESSDPDTVSHYRFVAVMTEYPEEGCIGLGDEIAAPTQDQENGS